MRLENFSHDGVPGRRGREGSRKRLKRGIGGVWRQVGDVWEDGGLVAVGNEGIESGRMRCGDVYGSRRVVKMMMVMVVVEVWICEPVRVERRVCVLWSWRRKLIIGKHERGIDKGSIVGGEVCGG